MVTAGNKNAYEVQNIDSGKLRDIHVARMRVYANQAMNVPANINDAFQKTADILERAEAEDGQGLLVIVDWTGFEKDEQKWEPIENM